MTEFVLSMTVFILRMTGLVLNMTLFPTFHRILSLIKNLGGLFRIWQNCFSSKIVIDFPKYDSTCPKYGWNSQKPKWIYQIQLQDLGTDLLCNGL